MSYDDDTARYLAIIANDQAADGHFIYAVKTTGIFCRPSCPSRTPNRENVEFFVSGLAAKRAGYRACKRCAPLSVIDPTRRLVIEMCAEIEARTDAPTLDELAMFVGVSAAHAQRIFKKILNISPAEYAREVRAKRLRANLADASTVTEALIDAGYSSPSRFYEKSAEILGMTPTQWRRGGEMFEIRYTMTKCSLGIALVAITDQGVCSVLLGDDEDELTEDLARRFAKATITTTRPDESELVERVVATIDAPNNPHPIPLDLYGTAFQRQVWRALQDIPSGTTTTYTQLAESIDRPTAARAVANACGANPIAVIIPCHRVLRADGSISGYRWGVARKQRLLAIEDAEESAL